MENALMDVITVTGEISVKRNAQVIVQKRHVTGNPQNAIKDVL